MKSPLHLFEISDEDILPLEQSPNFIFSQDRKDILKANKSIDVQACPGSGKTTLIAAKLILLAKKWTSNYEGICVLSHTNVAKDEIIDRLNNSKVVAAQKLLSYPHFIGTIQEFVQKYLAGPFIRSEGIEINIIDNNRCVDVIYESLTSKTKFYINNVGGREVLYDFDLKLNGSEIEINIPTFKKESPSSSYTELKDIRKKLIQAGCFFYKDFYVFAEKILSENNKLATILQKRFPIVFIDEMQDTQQYQDSLLQKIFPLDNNEISVQRFGDPDQAIFNGINGEEPNKSYNKKTKMDMYRVIDKSHRFDNDIAAKIRGLSYNEIFLETCISDRDIQKRQQHHKKNKSFKHTIFVYDDNTIQKVIPQFEELVLDQFSDRYKQSETFSVKAIGAISKSKNKKTTIGSYGPYFNKKESKKDFEFLIEAIDYCHQATDVDYAENYKILTSHMLKILNSNKLPKKGSFFNIATMKTYLEQNKSWEKYRKLMYFLLRKDAIINQDKWENIKSDIQNIFSIESFERCLTIPEEFLKKVHLLKEGSNPALLANNSIQLNDKIYIELSTIHGVKGETHDATLVLETFYYDFDLELVIPYLINPGERKTVRNEKKLKQLYVAMSRPRYLLCLAIHKDHITEEDVTKLKLKNWIVRII